MPKDEDILGETFNYNHLMRLVPGLDDGNLQSWIIGKTILKFDPTKSQKFHFDVDDEANESFTVGYHDDGTELLVPCHSEAHQFFTPVYFKKEVLNKYYDNPGKYKVDGLSSKHFSNQYYSLGTEWKAKV